MEDIKKTIRGIKDLDEIDGVMREAENQKLKVLYDLWEKCYKDRCQEHYLSLSDCLDDIKFLNHEQKCPDLKAMCLDSTRPVYIYDINNLCKDHGLSHGIMIPLMICEACACNRCKYLKEHLGYTCEDCRRDFYTGYQGYCDE